MRERAAGAYAEVVAQGRSRVQGVDDMAAVTDTRIGNVRRAELVIRAAHGTERHLLREPDDLRLGEMLASVRQLAETLMIDRPRWAAPPHERNTHSR